VIDGTVDGVDLAALNTAVATDSSKWRVPEAGTFGAATDLDANGALNANCVATGEIVDGTIIGNDVDSTAENFVFDGAYHITSATEDSAYGSKKYISDQLENALIQNPKIIGSLELTENIYQWNRKTDWDTSHIWAKNAPEWIAFPYDSGQVNPGCEDSSFATHPDWLYHPRPGGWNGWSYIQVHTPLGLDTATGTISAADENICMFVSNNGDYWAPFIAIDSVTYPDTGSWAYSPRGFYDTSHLSIVWGDTLENPFIDTLLYDTIVVGDSVLVVQHLSDCDARIFTNDTLYVAFRVSYRDSSGSPTNLAQAIWITRSGDGLNWIDTVRIFVEINGAGGVAHNKGWALSPTMFVDDSGKMTMYVVTDTSDVATWNAPAAIERRQSSDPLDTLDWQTGVDTCVWTSPWNEGMPGWNDKDLSPWHIDCQRVGSEIHCFELMCEEGTSGQMAQLFFAKSTDGLHFKTASQPVLLTRYNLLTWDDDRNYRASGIPVDLGYGWGYDLLYGALGMDSTTGNRWHIGRTTVHFTERWHFLEFDQVYGRQKTPDDSITLSLEYFDTTDSRIVWFCDSTNQGSDSDVVTLSAKADYTIETDSLIYWYKTTGKIDSLSLYTCRDSVAQWGGAWNYLPNSKVPDTLTWTDATDRTSTSVARVAVACSQKIYGGERVSLRFNNVLADDNDVVKVYYVALMGTKTGENQ
jgi:hypothetical protein